METAEAFRELDHIPTNIDAVLWPELESGFYQKCRESLEALTTACSVPGAEKTFFYVGAGISAYEPSCLPLASTVIRSLFEECARIYPGLKDQPETLVKALDQSAYVLMENVFQHLYECVQPHTFHAGRIFDLPDQPERFNVNHAFLARWLREGRGAVLTPNLDPLIEHAWRDLAQDDPAKLRVIRRPEQFEDWQQVIDQPDILWKLHGSSDDPESWAIILSRVGFGLEDARAEFIRFVVAEHNTCFVGYRAADLDLFPPILEAHASRKGGDSKVFWVFYFREGYKTLADYLEREPHIAQLVQSNPAHFFPIVTSAERLFTWLQSQCIKVEPTLPTQITSIPDYDYRQWFAIDLQAIGELAAKKLVGYTFRTIGLHSEALVVLDEAAESVLKHEGQLTQADELFIQRAAQLLQESAQTSWQIKDYATAISKVKRAQRLLRKIGNDLGTEFGFVSMLIDAKTGIPLSERIVAVWRLIRLHRRHKRMSKQTPSEMSPILGQGLCTLYEAKVVEMLLNKTPLIRLHTIRLSLIGWYGRAGSLIEKSKFLNSVPDVKRRQAFLWAPIDPQKAAEAMREAIRVAKVISQAHHELAVDRARSLLELIDDAKAKGMLVEAIESK
jgi:hypothetical protein